VTRETQGIILRLTSNALATSLAGRTPGALENPMSSIVTTARTKPGMSHRSDRASVASPRSLTGKPSMASACPFTSFARRVSDRPARLGTLLYGMVAYLLFFGTILYAIGFVGNWIVPKSIDSGTGLPLAASLAINASLLLVFVVQHTIMARPAFKRWWTTVIPPAIERSTFVMAASLSLALLFALWQPLPQTVWRVDHPIAAAALVALSIFGWATVFLSSFIINHFDLFGVRQVWQRYRNEQPTPVGFKLRGPYRLVRHPLMVGFLIAFWATPHMSIGHLFFAIMTTSYIFMGTWFEERDLVAEHGRSYRDYQQTVRAFVPIPRRTGRPTIEPYVP